MATWEDGINVLSEYREVNFLCEGGEVCKLWGNGYADARFVAYTFSNFRER